MLNRLIYIFSFLFLSSSLLLAQESKVSGKISTPDNNAVEGVHIYNVKLKKGSISSANGHFQIPILLNKENHIQVSAIGYKSIDTSFIPKGNILFILHETASKLNEVSVSAHKKAGANFKRIETINLRMLPSSESGVESILKTMPGVVSRNELSSQYSVRGGNFDENLIYVNGIEIHRSFLIRSGKQEGLSFINPQLVSGIQFSTGGFEAKYGDKMSSVLDIQYKKPMQFNSSVEASFLGGAAHTEGLILNDKFSYLIGARYHSTAYLLNSGSSDGEYKPNYTDVQSVFNYKLGSRSELQLLSNFSLNRYEFKPRVKSANIGSINFPIGVNIAYDGQEQDRFMNWTNSLNFTTRPTDQLQLNFNASAFMTREKEFFDIEGRYFIDALDQHAGSNTGSDSTLNIGIASMLNHARNELEAEIYTLQHEGSSHWGAQHLEWGIDARYESTRDKINEWELIDSAGFSTPYDKHKINLTKSIHSNNSLNNYRYHAYIQNTSKLYTANLKINLNYGVRVNYWTFNKEFLWSPRLTMRFESNTNANTKYKLAFGRYYQEPFYKEIRNPQGVINPNIKAPESIHYVLGMEHHFTRNQRPFKLQAEIFYKQLKNLIPYKLENIQIKYAGDNLAKGYSAGLDLKLSGEFVPGTDSWISLSLLKTEADIDGDYYIDQNGKKQEIGYYARPTDQRVNVSLFFHDYLPLNPLYQFHLKLTYGTGVPFALPIADRYDTPLRTSAYRRVDIGFFREFKKWKNSNFKELLIGAEIYNLLDTKNEISHLWINTVDNQSGNNIKLAVPNYLTGRKISLKLSLKF